MEAQPDSKFLNLLMHKHGGAECNVRHYIPSFHTSKRSHIPASHNKIVWSRTDIPQKYPELHLNCQKKGGHGSKIMFCTVGTAKNNINVIKNII